VVSLEWKITRSETGGLGQQNAIDKRAERRKNHQRCIHEGVVVLYQTSRRVRLVMEVKVLSVDFPFGEDWFSKSP
jgi:hypothetical protein